MRKSRPEAGVYNLYVANADHQFKSKCKSLVASLSRRECLVALASLSVVSGCGGGSSDHSSSPASPAPSQGNTPPGADDNSANSTVFTPEKFGAVGDGRTNDTDAFAQMSAAVSAAGGGKIVLQPTTYVVGRQGPDSKSIYSFAPATIMDFDGCTKALMISGQGARLLCAEGLRFGTFDRVTGQPTVHQLPYTDTGELAAPYEAMILVRNCAGDLQIEDLELDGNSSGLQIGGPYGDTGWQLPGDGIRLTKNTGSERILRVHSHHHARDGLMIIGVADRKASSSVEQLTSEYNARQGCSLVGGRNYTFVNSRFNHTGRAGLMSAPGAGVDLESEYAPIRDISFSGCEFSNNAGVGLISDVGDTAGVTVSNCRLVGTTTWSAWPKMPRFRFIGCQFVGAICNVFANADPVLATQFSNCSFVDDPALSPTREVYRPGEAIANLSTSEQVLFDGCRFELKSQLVLPWSWLARYNNCTMSQTSTIEAHPKGTYTGVCSIVGNVELYGAVILGDLTVNGKLMPRTA